MSKKKSLLDEVINTVDKATRKSAKKTTSSSSSKTKGKTAKSQQEQARDIGGFGVASAVAG
ncbi:MAG: hypothetical protein RRY18_03755 [Clostridia bacterium]